MFYGRAIDPTMLTALSAITFQKSAPMVETMKLVKQLLNYCASQEDEIMTIQKSDTKLVGHSDAGYLNKRKSHSREGGILHV